MSPLTVERSRPVNVARSAIVGSRLRRMPNIRSCVSDRSCSAATSVSAAISANDSCTNASRRSSRSEAIAERYLRYFVLPTILVSYYHLSPDDSARTAERRRHRVDTTARRRQAHRFSSVTISQGYLLSRVFTSELSLRYE